MSLHKTGIPWATRTWSPGRGCRGCEVGSACWALKTCWRMAHNPNPKVAAQFEGLVEVDWCDPPPGVPADCASGRGYLPCDGGQCWSRKWTGTIRTYPEEFDAPLRARKPQVVFVWPHGDVAHAGGDTIRSIFGIMAQAARHQFLVLTKAPDKLIGKLFVENVWAGPVRGHDNMENVWLGVSATDQATYDERVGALCDPETGWPGNKWVSLEPCMGPVDLAPWIDRGMYAGLSWTIAGSADSLAHGADKFTPEIARALRDQCEAAGVPFWLKQGDSREFCPREFAGYNEGDHGHGRCDCIPHKTITAPCLDGRQHFAAPDPIARILREAGRP